MPVDLNIPEKFLPAEITEPTTDEIEDLPPKYHRFKPFFYSLVNDIEPTKLNPAHISFLRTLGIKGDPHRAYLRLAAAEGADDGKNIILGSAWGYRHDPAFKITPSQALINFLLDNIRDSIGLADNENITVLDFMAGGGVIPLEAVRYGCKVFANDLNPVASTTLKATLEYPSKYDRLFSSKIEEYAKNAHKKVIQRLSSYFPLGTPDHWWPQLKGEAEKVFAAKAISNREPAYGYDPIMNTFLCLGFRKIVRDI